MPFIPRHCIVFVADGLPNHIGHDRYCAFIALGD
jgi:hypothetical protein